MAEGKILRYLDIPFQHANERVLTAMKRPAAREKTLLRIARWREICPDITIRSTFIVGFPGETDQDFDELLAWLGEAKLDRVGCFRFEPVAGAAANALPDPVPDEVKDNRWHRLMRAQQEISTRKLKARVGRRLTVLVDESAGRTAKGRSSADAPEIDGVVHLNSRLPIRAGEIVTARIERSDAYDLHGQVV
jgi:ribosomal protein S12 methylthiotransferase